MYINNVFVVVVVVFICIMRKLPLHHQNICIHTLAMPELRSELKDSQPSCVLSVTRSSLLWERENAALQSRGLRIKVRGG